MDSQKEMTVQAALAARAHLLGPLHALVVDVVLGMPAEATVAHAKRKLRAELARHTYPDAGDVATVAVPWRTPNAQAWGRELVLKCLADYFGLWAVGSYAFTPVQIQQAMPQKDLSTQDIGAILKDSLGILPVRNGSYRYWVVNAHGMFEEVRKRGLYYEVTRAQVSAWLGTPL